MSGEIFYHRYSLTPRVKLNAQTGLAPREGALLAIGGGYADLHPWPEFGDAPIEEQLASLKTGRDSDLTLQARQFASIDQNFRNCGESAFRDIEIPKSHILIANCSELPGAMGKYGAGTYKVKVGISPHAEVTVLNYIAASGFVFRLDANESFDKKGFLSFWNSLSRTTRSCIEFIEDPFPLSEGWDDITDVPLALDKAKPQEAAASYRYRIIKPASQDAERVAEEEVQLKRKFVVTSSMDHPLGQVAAAWMAGMLFKKYPAHLCACGLLSHSVYEANEFSPFLQEKKLVLIPPSGTGFGFNEVLKNIPWKKL